MDDGGSPTLEVGFAIDAGGSFEQLVQLQRAMDSTEAKVIADAARMERATGSMLNLGGAAAEMTAFGSATTRELQNINREKARTEKAGEGLIRQLEREAAALGKTKDQMRDAKVEAIALAAAEQGNTDLADRIAVAARNRQIAAQNAAEAEVRAASQAAAAMQAQQTAAQRLAASRADLAAKVQASHAAQEADAVAAERMRMATDPLYAATSRLNAEIAESTRLYYAGATAPAEYARQQEYLTQKLRETEAQQSIVTRGMGTLGTTGKLTGFHMQNMAFQFQDLGMQMAMAAQSSRPFSMAMMALFQQGTQIKGIMSQAGVGIGAVARQLLATVAPFTAVIAVAGLLGAAFGNVKNGAEGSDASLKQYIGTLGLTRKEIEKLKDTHVTWGDVARSTFDVLAARAGTSAAAIGDAWGSTWSFIGNAAVKLVAGILAAFASFVELAASLLRNLGKFIVNTFTAAANGAIGALEGLLNFAIGGINKFAQGANAVIDKLPAKLRDGLGIREFGDIAEVSFGRVKGAMDLSNPLKDMQAQGDKTFRDILSGFEKIGRGADAYRDKRLKQQADEIIADRAAEKAKKPKVDRHAEQLARENEAIEAQIRNLYALADAYRVSGAAALIAEARVKAESDAIKKRGDIELFVNRQIRLAIAQRVVDAAKSTATMRDSADAQARVNAMVEAGLVPAGQAADLVKAQIADLPLLAAIEAAQQQGLATDAAKATAALADQRAERERLAEAERHGQFLSASAERDNEIATLREELRLVGATDDARRRSLAMIKAVQEAQKFNPGDRAAYIGQQLTISDLTAQLAEQQRNYNAALSFTADLFAQIDSQAQSMSDSLSDAFGNVGSGIGDALTALTSYAATQEKIETDRRAAIKAAGTGPDSYAAIARIEILAAKQSSVARAQATMQAISGIKSMFKEHSTAYKVMSAIEKAYAAWQAAETIASIARDVSKTVSSIANSGARTTANTAEGASKIFAELGPWAFPVVAAMVAVLAALGANNHGGGASGPSIPTAEDMQAAQGTGTVLGDSTAKSASIANSLEIMAKNSTKGLDFTGDMVRSLHKIESGIGNLAAAVARSLGASGGFFDPGTMNLGTTGSSGFLGMFGSSKTKSLFDQGLQFNSASVANIIANGISGLTYNVVETIKKKNGFFGIGGSTKTSYSTTTGGLDPDISRQFQLIVGSVYDSVVASAKILGLDVGNALKTFQVEIGKISFKDLKGDEITQALEAVFSKVADQMAGFAVDGLETFQKAGEGLFETLSRLAKDYLTIDTALSSVGLTFGAVGMSSIAAREALLDLMGGLDEFVSQINYYYDNFLTDAEQQAFMQSQVNAAFAAMGVAVPPSIDAFKQLVDAQDLTTEAGQALFAALMSVAPAFYEIETAADKAAQAAQQAADQIAKQRTALQIQLLEAQGKAAEALAMKRAQELDAMDESLRGLQRQVWAAQDVAKAKDDLNAAYRRESQTLQQTADKFHKFADTLRDFRSSIFAGGSSPLSYAQSLTKLMEQGGLAAGGDEAALGGGLRDAASKFLDIAQQNAGSLADLQRARAMVARYLDGAIGGAEGQASLAEQQLDQMKDQVGKLIDIDDHVLTVAEAIDKLNALLSPTAPSTGGGGSYRPSRPADGDGPDWRGINDRLDRLLAATETGTIAQNKLTRIFDRADRGGALAIVTDADSPVAVDGGLDLS